METIFLYLKGKKTNVIRAAVMMKVTEKKMYLMLIKKKKNEGLALKQNDKDSADKTKVVLTADTEALLLAQLNSANVMYFRSKVNLHNFTFYNLKSRDVMNYLWG